MGSIMLCNMTGSYNLCAYLTDMDPLRLMARGPLFVPVELEIEYDRRDVRWRASRVVVIGFFEESKPDPEWNAPDLLSFDVTNPGWQPKWLQDFIANNTPSVT